MTANEALTLLISVAAFGVSFVSLYFSTWHKKVALIGCLVRVDVPFAEDVRCDTYEFAFSNSGNQELLLREVHIEPEGMLPGELIPELSVENVPQVIKPGAVGILKVPIPQSFLTQAGKESRNVKLLFEVFTSKAKKMFVHKVLSPGQNKDDWKPFELE